MNKHNKKIYIIQLQTYTLPALLIKLLTRKKYSHVGISLEKECNTIYSFGRKKVNNFLNGGFVIEKRDGQFFKKFNKSICKIYEVEIDKEKYDNLKYILDDMEMNKDNYKYDYLGIFLRCFNIPITFKNKYVCSYFIADILDRSEITKFDKKCCFVRPADFDDLLGTVIYEGKYDESI